MDFVTSALIATWVAVFLLALVVSGLIRQVHQLSRQVAGRPPQRVGPRPGDAAPGLEDLLGAEPGADRAALLLFLSGDCRTCTDVLAEASRWAARQGAHAPAVRAVYAGPAPEQEASVPVVADRADLFERYDAIATPFAVLVDDRARVLRSEPVGSTAALHDLLDAVPPIPTAVEARGRTRSAP